MSFSADWLALRAAADDAARDQDLLAAAVEVAQHAAGGTAPVIVDLGCGAGATARAFAPHLPGARWRLVDADPALLALAVRATGGAAHRLDLGAIDALPLEGAHLVTASALLDLMPADWIARLAARLAALGLPFYAALTYDGAMAWTPPDPADAAVTAAFNAHQRGDKGLGPALGPDAAGAAAAALARAGFALATAPSPWRLGPEQAELHGELVTGIAAAAAEMGCAEAAGWAQARRAAGGYASAVIGHADLLARPAACPTMQSNSTSEPSP